MALHHNASNMHLSLTRRTSPLLACAETLTERPLGFIDPVTTHVRRVLTVSTAWKPLRLTRWCSSPLNHRGLRLRSVRMRDVKLRLVSCLYPQYCAANIHPREALWRWPYSGWEELWAVLPSSSIGSCSLMHPCEGDSASLGHLLRALSPVYLTVSPHCWSTPTSSRCTYAHQRQ